MSDEEQTRDEIEEVAKEDEPAQEAAIETITEEETNPVIAKPEAKAKAKPKIKITKEPVEQIKEEEPEPVVEEKP